jgi:transposase
MIPQSVRIFVCTEPQDMRRSFDGLALATQQVLAEDPQSGALFCFVNKRANRLKILWWDRNGYCLLYKRLHRAVFQFPASTGTRKPSVRIDGPQLASLISGVERERRTRSRRTC